MFGSFFGISPIGRKPLGYEEAIEQSHVDSQQYEPEGQEKDADDVAAFAGKKEKSMNSGIGNKHRIENDEDTENNL